MYVLRKIFLILALSSGILASNLDETSLGVRYYQELKNLSDSQLDTLLKVWRYGVDDDLSYTLAAIAWKESNFGKYTLNLSDGKYGSFGVFHINLEYHIKRVKASSNWSRDREAEKLLNSLEYSTSHALGVLKYYISYHTKKSGGKSSLVKAIASYNAGFNHKSSKGQAYSKDVVLRIKVLTQFFKQRELEGKLKAIKIAELPKY